MASVIPTIVTLNTDCLYKIFSQIPLRELFILEAVCKRFQSVVRMIYQTKYCVLDFHKINVNGQPVSAMQAKGISRRMGPFVHTLKASRKSFNMTGRTVPKSMLIYCKYLQCIYLYELRLSDKNCISKRLIDAMWIIREVHFVDCTFNDNIGECLRKSNQLEVIRFTNNKTITGEFLNGLKGIKEINLWDCPNIQPQHFRQFCEENPQLRKINIKDCPQIDAACLRIMATLTNLETLVINDTYIAGNEDYLALARLPNILNMKIYFKSFKSYDESDDEFYDELDYRTHNANGFLLQLSETSFDRLVVLNVNGIVLDKRNLDALERFTQLRILSLDFAKIFANTTLTRLSCKNTLQKLSLHSWKSLTSETLIELIKNFICLKTLDVSYCKKLNIQSLKDLDAHLDHELEIVAKESYFSSTSCNQNELRLVLSRLRKIKLNYKGFWLPDDEYPRTIGHMWVLNDQLYLY